MPKPTPPPHPTPPLTAPELYPGPFPSPPLLCPSLACPEPLAAHSFQQPFFLSRLVPLRRKGERLCAKVAGGGTLECGALSCSRQASSMKANTGRAPRTSHRLFLGRCCRWWAWVTQLPSHLPQKLPHWHPQHCTIVLSRHLTSPPISPHVLPW